MPIERLRVTVRTAYVGTPQPHQSHDTSKLLNGKYFESLVSEKKRSKRLKQIAQRMNGAQVTTQWRKKNVR